MMLVTSIVLLLPAVVAFPNGASPKACLNLTPQHDAAPQSIPAPYIVQLDKVARCNNDVLQVNITAKSTLPISGLMMQVRSSNGGILDVEWLHLPEELKTMNCEGGSPNTVTQKEPLQARYAWGHFKLPDTITIDTIVVAVTIAAQKNIHWVSVFSDPSSLIFPVAACTNPHPEEGPFNIDPNYLTRHKIADKILTETKYILENQSKPKEETPASGKAMHLAMSYVILAIARLA